jgi:hypothetical protein
VVQKLNKTLDIPNIFQYIQLFDSQQFVASRLVWGDENDMARAKAATPRGAGFDLIIGESEASNDFAAAVAAAGHIAGRQAGGGTQAASSRFDSGIQRRPGTLS